MRLLLLRGILFLGFEFHAQEDVFVQRMCGP